MSTRDALHLALDALTERSDVDPGCDCARCVAIRACREALRDAEREQAEGRITSRRAWICDCCNLPAPDECACNEYCNREE